VLSTVIPSHTYLIIRNNMPLLHSLSSFQSHRQMSAPRCTSCTCQELHVANNFIASSESIKDLSRVWWREPRESGGSREALPAEELLWVPTPSPLRYEIAGDDSPVMDVECLAHSSVPTADGYSVYKRAWRKSEMQKLCDPAYRRHIKELVKRVSPDQNT